MYYHADKPGIKWNSEVRQFGYQAVNDLFSAIGEVLQ